MIEKEMQALQKACGTRVIVDGKSTITNIPNKAFYDKCLIYSETNQRFFKMESDERRLEKLLQRTFFLGTGYPEKNETDASTNG